MSNFITCKALDLHMNNGLTCVLIETLALSGSRLAQNDRERELVMFLAEKDQNIVGGGTVGFSISEMPWNTETFAQEKAFLLQAADMASARLGWESLGYEPNEQSLLPALTRFRELVCTMQAQDINHQAVSEWREASQKEGAYDNGFAYCPKHHVIKTCFGCILCSTDANIID